MLSIIALMLYGLYRLIGEYRVRRGAKHRKTTLKSDKEGPSWTPSFA